ncbi:DHH family phosphoesterase, partial [Oleiphilus sp. HI0079]
SRLADLTSLKGLDSAVNLLVTALTSGQKITIIGDFDADGATSSTLAVEALTAMGAKDCGYLVPDRFKFGYGLTPEIVELAGQNSPDILLTVDNGISSFEGVARAHELGMKVIVTDHHLPGDSLPDADAIVNPAQPECEFPSKALAGVGVIFYVMSALRARLRESEWFSKQSIKEPNMADYLDLVALGTVADLVPLDFNNRILVEQGIRRMRAGRARPGISALFEVAGREIKNAV